MGLLFLCHVFCGPIPCWATQHDVKRLPGASFSKHLLQTPRNTSHMTMGLSMVLLPEWTNAKVTLCEARRVGRAVITWTKINAHTPRARLRAFRLADLSITDADAPKRSRAVDRRAIGQELMDKRRTASCRGPLRVTLHAGISPLPSLGCKVDRIVLVGEKREQRGVRRWTLG